MFNSKKQFTGEFTHHYSGDPALDTDAEAFDFEQYKRTGDAKFLPLKNGSTPVTFRMRRLNGREWMAVQDEQRLRGPNQGLWLAVAFALTGIEGYGDNADIDRVSEQRFERCNDETMEQILAVDDGELLVELGTRVKEEMEHDPLS